MCAVAISEKAIIQDSAAVISTKTMTSEELSALSGTELREVEFDIPVKDVNLLRKIPEFCNYNPAIDVLKMIKPIYGLKDAPRLWWNRLDKTFRTRLGMTPTRADRCCYVMYKDQLDEKEGKTISATKLQISNRKFKKSII